MRRTILVIEDKNNLLIGYELREGKEERSINKAPIKSYRKDRIANFGDYSRLKMSKKNYKRKDQDSTLLRETLQEALLSGV